MTSKEVEQIANNLFTKYVLKGGSYKFFSSIMQEENIKYREIDTPNCEFIGALTKGNSNQFYIMIHRKIDNEGRKNFTIAHELGHYFLSHHLQSSFFFCFNDTITEESYSTNRIEAEANHFAACFLMPEQKLKSAFLSMLQYNKRVKVKDFLHVTNDYTFGIWCGIHDNLMKRYGVSEAALRFRLRQLKLAKFDFR